MSGIARKFVIILMLSMAACGSESDRDEYQPLDFESFVDGKEDTGYVSNKAAELEAKLTAKVYIDMTGKTPQEIQELADSLPGASRWTLQKYTSPQLKYARNPLKSEKLDLNLERGEPVVLNVSTGASGVWLEYENSIESLVKFKELEEKGLTPADLVGKLIDFILPAAPESVFEKGGLACAADPDGDELHEEDLNADNYFYYFDPSKPGCPLQAPGDLVDARYEILSSLDARSVYPEYDLLTADKRITMVNLFGQIEHGDLLSGDLGWTAYNQFKRDFQYAGFSVTETFPDDFGVRMEKTYPGGLEVIANFYTPEALKDHRPREEVNQLFMQAIHDHEMVYYNGHAFYGSLTVLDKPEAYPQETYQIINMDACWSYAYYTKQVFSNKADAQKDPDGMKYADVVNNTEPGITGSHKTAWLLYKNIFNAASEFMQGQEPSKYSWNNLIVYMNDSAEQRARWYDPEKFHAEIYGASGVTGNCFNPAGPSFCKENGGSTLTHEYEDATETPIPDNHATGVERTINVPDSYNLLSVQVELDIRHTYIGDLRVALTHNGSERVLHDNSGGGSDDIRTSVDVSGFAGQDAAGDWTLKIVDSANYDTGRLVGWKLILTESSEDPGAIEGQNNQARDIPDNDPAGISSMINIADSAAVGSVVVHVDITHTYVGDLVLKLEHGGAAETLQNREGGSNADIDRDFLPAAFAGADARGDWVLTVSDHAGADTGRLNSWSIRIVPAR